LALLLHHSNSEDKNMGGVSFEEALHLYPSISIFPFILIAGMGAARPARRPRSGIPSIRGVFDGNGENPNRRSIIGSPASHLEYESEYAIQLEHQLEKQRD
jgi:hypothetical protein